MAQRTMSTSLFFLQTGLTQNGYPMQPQTPSFPGAVGMTLSPQTLLAKILGCMGTFRVRFIEEGLIIFRGLLLDPHTSFLLAELYLESDRIEDAHDCVAEAISLSQINHELLFLVSTITHFPSNN